MIEEPQTIDPKNIKNLLYSNQNLTKQHSGYNYYEMDNLEVEIDEFIAYSETRTELNIYKEKYEESFPTWSQLTEQNKKSCIQQLMDSLESEEKRSCSLKSVAYISLGTYGELLGQDKAKHLENIKSNNKLLFEMDIISTLKQLLSQACQIIEMSSSVDIVNSTCKEVDVCLTTLYLVVISNKQYSILLQENQLAEFLFDLVVRLKEHFTKTFPLKKLMLNIWKILLFTLGDLNEEYETLKKDVRQAYELPIYQNKEKTVKCTPEDLHVFYNQSVCKYPTFTPKKLLGGKLQSPLTITPSKKLVELMGLVEETNKTELPFQTLFPSKNPISQQQQQQQQQQGTKDDNNNKSNEINLLPFEASGSMIPYSLSEANRIWLNHLYISVADYQIIHEREKGIHRWQIWKKQQEEDYSDDDEWDHIFAEKLQEKHRIKLEYIEHLYKSIVPYFHNIVVVLLKLLLSTMSSGKDKEAEIMEDVNITRNRETTSKAATSILLLLLKWFKASHILKFEYLAHTLIDSGCMLLILKLLGMQEIALLTSRKTDDDQQSFFGYVQQLKPEDSVMEEVKEYTNKRNLCWTINLLRILQMLSKRKTQRILLLVQYKSSAIIKKLLKVGHPTVDLYALKNLKSQIPFLGRKWRSSNMKTISSIYSHCLTSLNDNWLSTPDVLIDIEDTTIKEKHLRTLVRLYNGKKYMQSLLPSMDEINGQEKLYFYSDINNGLPDYSVNQSIIFDNVELDIEFKHNYRSFLDKEVYSIDAEEEDDDDDDANYNNEGHQSETEPDNKWTIDTPIPENMPTAPISAKELANEINRLYSEELQNEFQMKQQLKKEKEQSGWDSPSEAITNAWGEAASLPEEEDESQTTADQDPLTGINWDCLTEEDLNRRLNLVEEKTVQRWLSVDMEDPRYLKVLNTFETEIDIDDEGWPTW